MKDAEHRKQMLLQQIADHRELMRLEMEVLQESQPIKPVIEITHRLLGVFDALRPHRRSAGGRTSATRGGQSEIELVRTTLPLLVPVLRAMLHRRKERRARRKKQA